jgi:long-chain acyl-CoA synthetase
MIILWVIFKNEHALMPLFHSTCIYVPLEGMTGGPLTCCDVKLVSWEEGNYRIKDWPNPRGEIHIGGSNVAVGYYKQPEKTKEEFYDENGRHWFRTGDIGEFSQEGFLQVNIF